MLHNGQGRIDACLGDGVLLRKAAKIKKGTGTAGKEIVGKVTMAQVREIAEMKMVDLNAYDIEQAAKMICGSARSMGIEVEGA